jgi:hypothetical protein
VYFPLHLFSQCDGAGKWFTINYRSCLEYVGWIINYFQDFVKIENQSWCKIQTFHSNAEPSDVISRFSSSFWSTLHAYLFFTRLKLNHLEAKETLLVSKTSILPKSHLCISIFNFFLVFLESPAHSGHIVIVI